MNNIVIKGGQVISPADKLNGHMDIFLIDGKIIAYDSPPEDFVIGEEICAQDCLVIPGLVDLYAQIQANDPDTNCTIASELTAARANGISHLCSPPVMDKAFDSADSIYSLHQQTKDANYPHHYPIGALSRRLEGEELADLASLKAAGCPGVSNGAFDITNTQTLLRCYQYAANFDLTVFIEAQDSYLADKACVHQGVVSDRLGLRGIPSCAETIAINRHLALVEETGVKVHFHKLSTAQGVELIRQAKQQGLPVTADVSAHHLFLTDMDNLDFNSLAHVRPPLRQLSDQQALIKGLKEGSIAAICSDHTPLSPMAKSAPFAQTQPGISAFDTYLALGLKLVFEKHLSYEQWIRSVTSQPAKILGLNLNVGNLALGCQANLCIIDPEKIWQLSPESMISESKHSPFMGWEFAGRVVKTL